MQVRVLPGVSVKGEDTVVEFPVVIGTQGDQVVWMVDDFKEGIVGEL